MSLDKYIAELEKMEAHGAVVFLKWDGERTENRRTVVVTRHNSDYVFRRDTDDLAATLRDAIEEYWSVFG